MIFISEIYPRSFLTLFEYMAYVSSVILLDTTRRIHRRQCIASSTKKSREYVGSLIVNRYLVMTTVPAIIT